MGILRDIIDAKDDFLKGSDIAKSVVKDAVNHNSIARKSNNGVLQFPVYITDSLSLENCTMISKALEREYVSFIAVLTSINSITDKKSIKEYLEDINLNDTNIGSKVGNLSAYFSESSVFKIPNMRNTEMIKESESTALNLIFNTTKDGNKVFNSDDFITENYNELTTNEKDNIRYLLKEKCKNNKAIKFSSASGIDSIIIQEHSENKHLFMLRDINTMELKLVETVVFPVNDINKDIIVREIMNESKKLSEVYTPDLNTNILNESTPSNLEDFSLIGTGLIKNKYSKLKEADSGVEVIDFANDKNTNSSSLGSRDVMVANKTGILTDNDIKKANELAPTLMHLKTFFKNDEGSLFGIDYIIGVKTVMHNVTSESMITNILSTIKRGKGFFNLVKLTTGEISFFKDFLFAVNKSKDDIKKKFSKDDAWAATLTRKKEGRIYNGYIPNASLVLSIDEVEILRNEHNVDVMNEKMANLLINRLYLLSLVIVDPSIEVAYFKFDGEKNFQKYSFTALERENSNATREVKNIMQVMSRM